MTHRHYQYAAGAGAVLLATAATACLYRDLYVIAAMFWVGVAVCLEASARERRRHLRSVAEHEWARRVAVGDNPQPLRPCCLLAGTSRGRAHHHDRCTRNPIAALLLAADTDYPITRKDN
ncbi:hypothetical protein [Streptomyces sp. NBC_00645]|uniref:hypothetical protein n=1 Tax=Streptomyces sp. NBC_00645 TaxID=2975795 RepID=UPI003247859D